MCVLVVRAGYDNIGSHEGELVLMQLNSFVLLVNTLGPPCGSYVVCQYCSCIIFETP
jgi:hypothetical protein